MSKQVCFKTHLRTYDRCFRNMSNVQIEVNLACILKVKRQSCLQSHVGFKMETDKQKLPFFCQKNYTVERVHLIFEMLPVVELRSTPTIKGERLK